MVTVFRFFKKKAYFVFKNAHESLRDRKRVNTCHERVICVVLIGCRLSLERVADVDQEGPPGEGDAEAGFEATTEILK